MKRLLFCLVALIAVFALVMPTYATEMKVSGMFFAKGIARDNYNGSDDHDDSSQYVNQRFRMYFNFISSENLKLVYKNEIDMDWGDSSTTVGRNQGGGLGGDSINLETKNVYLEFMVPDTPVRATMGLQGITLHKGWFVSDDLSAAKFDMNFDPVSITAYWAGLEGLGVGDADASNDRWSLVGSGAYKAENMDARLSLAYERNPNDTASADNPENDDLFLLMLEMNMSFDMVSFFVIGATNFGEVDSNDAQDRDYSGYMFNAGVNVALDMATIRAQFIFASGDDEKAAIDTDGDGIADTIPLDDDNFQGLGGQTFSWSELMSDGYFSDKNPTNTQIGGSNHPSNMYAINVGADFKPTDTTTIKFDVYYIGMVEDRSVGCDPTVNSCDEDEIGLEIDAKLTQKIYDNLSLSLVGAYLFAEDGYGAYNQGDGEDTENLEFQDNSGDDAFQVGIGLDYKF